MRAKFSNNMVITAVAALSTILALSAFAAATPTFHPSISIQRSQGQIRIDGNLDDSAWKTAARADNFVERYPGENIDPQVGTEALLTYDNDNLYVAFRCYDDPAKIRASMCQRDQFDDDDAVAVLIDTYGNATWAYELVVNPYGIQKDALWTSVFSHQGHDGDEGFDLTWESAAMITDSGYQAELSIPFASLRFPNRESQEWRIDFWRIHPREIEREYSWAAYNHNDQCWVCQWGTINGINNVKPGKGLEILPTLIVSQAGAMVEPWGVDAPFKNDDAEAEGSIGAKYSVTSDIIMEATYNPDFSQIETDEAQIDVNTTIALQYPERRPFFQEGSDIFRTLFNSFYSRTINDPQFAAKFTGRPGQYSIGFLSAYDENTPYMIPLEERSALVNTGKSYVNILRGSRAFGNDNRLGFIVTDRRFDGGGYGTVVSADGNLRLSEKYNIVAQYIYSFSEEPVDSSTIEHFGDYAFDRGRYTVALDGEKFEGDALISQFRRQARNWSFTLNYDYVAPAYRTETGYDPWNDYRNLNFYTNYNFYPTKGIFEVISPQTGTENRWNYDESLKWSHKFGGVFGNLRFWQTYLGVTYHAGEERWAGIKFNDLWNVDFETGSQFSDNLGYEFGVNFGKGVAHGIWETGKELNVYGELAVKPVDRVLIGTTIGYSRSEDNDSGEELFRQTIARTRVRYQISKELSLRLIMQYDDYRGYFGEGEEFEIDPLITYRINSFSVFYVGSTHNSARFEHELSNSKEWKNTSRQFFMKLQYLFRT